MGRLLPTAMLEEPNGVPPPDDNEIGGVSRPTLGANGSLQDMMGSVSPVVGEPWQVAVETDGSAITHRGGVKGSHRAADDVTFHGGARVARGQLQFDR